MKKKFSLRILTYISFLFVITTFMLVSVPIVAHAYTSEYPTVTISGADNDEWNGMYTPIPYTACTYQNYSGAIIRLVGFRWLLNPSGSGLAYFSNVYTSSTIPPKTGWLRYAYTDDNGYLAGAPDPDFSLTYPIASLAQTETTVSEAAGSVSITVQLSEATSYETYIKYRTDDGTSQAGTDFTGVTQAENKTVYIPPWQTSADITIPITNDDTYENSENFTVSIYNISGGARIQTGSMTVTVENDDPFPAVGFASDSFLADEEGGSADIRFGLFNPSCNDITVNYQTAGVGESGTGYTPESGTVTIPAGATSASFAVHGLGSLPKTISVNLSSPSGAALGTYPSATVTILKTKAYFAQTAVSANETATGTSLEICLSDPAEHDIEIDYSTTDGSAAAGEDYTAVTGTLIIPAGEASGFIDIPLVNDIVYEEDETFTVSISNPVGTVLEDQTTATVSIINDDSRPTMQFSADTASINENDGSVSLLVTLSNPSGFDLSVNYTTANGTAKAGQDYTSQSGTLTIPKGAVEGYVDIPIINNSIYDSNRYFTVTLSNPSGAILGTRSSTAVTIVNDEPIPSVQFTQSAISINETAGEVVVPVQFSHPTASLMQVFVRTSNGTAVAGQDYTAHTSGHAVGSGNTSFSLHIPILNDNLYEGDETFNITLSMPYSGCVLGEISVCTVTIESDELPYEIQFSSNNLAANEDAENANLTVQLSRVSGSNTTVHYQTADNTAQAGEDYTSKTGVLTIPAGVTSGTISIPILNDNIYEANEDFAVTLTEPGGANGTILGAETTATVTIVSEDAKPGIQFSTDSVTISENIGTVEFIIQLSHPSGSDLSVDFGTSGNTAVGGEDYIHKIGTLIIPKGDVLGNVSLSIINDDVYEENESFLLELTASSGATLGTITCVTVNVTEDDPLPTVEFSSNTASVGEDDGSVGVNVLLSGPSAFDISVDYTTENTSAEAGKDYTQSTGTLTIPKGTLTGTIDVPVSSDTVYEGDENFTVSISSPLGAVLGAKDTVDVTIFDEDLISSVAFISDTVVVGEDEGSIEISAVLSHPSAFDITVNYETSDISTAVGEDYTFASSVLTIPKETIAASVTIPVLNDNVYEADESFAVTFSSPSGAVLGANSMSTVTIESEDLVPAIELFPDSVSIGEDGSSVTVYTQLSHPSAFDITVDFNTTDESAISEEDYTSQTGVLTISKGMTSGSISVTILNDDTYEGDETFTVNISTPSGAALGDKKTATVTIVSEEKEPEVEFTTPTISISEAASSAKIPVRLSHLSVFDVAVNYQTIDASGKAGEDYSAASGTLKIPAGSISHYISIPIIPDSVYEGNEDLKVILSDASGAILGTYYINTVTIEEDDKPTITGVKEEYSIYDGSRIILDPQPSGGTWDWDRTFFSATFNSPATFTALKTGASTITYTIGGSTQSIAITTLPAELPATGQNFTWGYILLGLAACTLGIGVFLHKKTGVKKQADSNADQ